MSITTTIEQKRIELREIRKDMAGINPKLSTYKKLEEQAKKIEEEIASLGMKRTKAPEGASA